MERRGGTVGWVGGRGEDTQKGQREGKTEVEREGWRRKREKEEETERDRQRQAVRTERAEQTKEYKAGVNEPRSQYQVTHEDTSES